jgi:spermidine/putrescine transport system permease protein
VTLRWALPGIGGGWLLAFTFSFDEFIIAWFVAGFDETLPVAIYNAMMAEHRPTLNAIGTIVFGLLLLALLGAELLIVPLLMRRGTARAGR